MGYAFAAYAVDLPSLSKLYGSKDKKFPAKALKIGKTRIADTNESFEEEITEHKAPDLKRALEEMIEGRCVFKHAGFMYGYALEVMCETHGKRVDNESLSWFDEAIDPYLKKSSMKMLGDNRRPMPFPEPDNFPGIGSIDAKQVVVAEAAFTTALPLAKKKDDDDATEVFEEILGWLRAAKKKKSGLVWFVY